MLQGTKSEKFQESLSLDPPMTFSDLFVRANKYISPEEVMRMVFSKESKEGKKRESEFESSGPVKRDRVDKAPKLKFNSFTPLNESRATILATIEKSGLLEFLNKVDGNLERSTMPIATFTQHEAMQQSNVGN